MEKRAGGNRYWNLLVLSVVANLLLAVYAGYTLEEGRRLREQIDDLSGSYSDLVESTKNMEQQLNMTVNQLEYYKGLAEYYSNLTASRNVSAGVRGGTAIPIVATYQVGGWFRSELRGVVMEADVELREGSGRVLVDTVPRIGIDIQTSVRTAVRVAEEATGVQLSGTDVILTITSEQETDVVDGPSAGAAITIAIIAAITDEDLNEGVYMTGTINSDGTIGPVGGIPEKATAAAESGARRFLVPEGQGTVIVYVPKTTHPVPGMTITRYEQKLMGLGEYLEEQGYDITVEEVETIEQAYDWFT
jgi:uncharacterized protein